MPASFSENLAIRRRFISPDTTAFRVMDGAVDGYDGVFADQLGERVLVSTRDRKIPSQLLNELREMGVPLYHKRLDQNVKLAPVKLWGEDLPDQFEILENGIKFLIDMQAGYSQGLFLDQRENRQRVRERSREGASVLNTFAYTGAFSVYAALGGAVTTTLDLAQPCLSWAKDNFAANGIDAGSQYFCKGDTFHWLERFAKQGRLFDGIVLDPPTFSRNGDGKVFRVESHYGDLVRLAKACLVPHGGWILCTTNCRALYLDTFMDMVTDAAPGAEAKSYDMPADFRGEQYLKTVWLNF